jgi:hypothetical protein
MVNPSLRMIKNHYTIRVSAAFTERGSDVLLHDKGDRFRFTHVPRQVEGAHKKEMGALA